MEKKPARKRRRAKPKQYTLTQRDLALLASIHDFGGVLTTVQISTLHWPPDVGRRLAGWGVPNERIAAWLERYPPAYLAEKHEQLKWGLRINRMREKAEYNKADLKLVEWISKLEPLLQEELRPDGVEGERLGGEREGVRPEAAPALGPDGGQPVAPHPGEHEMPVAERGEAEIIAQLEGIGIRPQSRV